MAITYNENLLTGGRTGEGDLLIKKEPVTPPEITPELTPTPSVPLQPIVTSAPAKKQVTKDVSDMGAELEQIKQGLLKLQEQAKTQLKTEVVPEPVRPEPTPAPAPAPTPALETDFDKYTKQREAEALAETNKVNNLIEQMRANASIQNQALIRDIQYRYNEQILAQKKINTAVEAAVTTMGIRSGRQRYAPEIEIGNITQATVAGIEKINALENQKSSLIQQAETAYKAEDYKLLYDSMEKAREINKNKDAAIKQFNDDMIAREKALIDRQKAVQDALGKQLEEKRKTIENIAPGVVENMTWSDVEHDSALIKSIATAQGVPVDELYSAAVKYRDEQSVKNDTTDLRNFAAENNQRAANGLPAYKTLSEYQAAVKTGGTTGTTGTTGIPKTPENQTLMDSFNSASLGLSAAQLKSAQSTFNQYLVRGDREGAIKFIVRTATVGLPAVEQTQAIGRSQAIIALKSIKDLIIQAVKLGSDPNIVSGNITKFSQKLGTTNDVNLTYIGSRIQQQLQTYRRAMTGAAFTSQESAEYKKIFPDITNDTKLNTVIIQALIDGLDSNNKAQLAFVIGDTNYDKLFGTLSNATLPSTGNKIKVRLQDGRTGAIDEKDFNANTMTKI